MEQSDRVYKNRKKMFVDNFIGGIAWALGATVGIAIIGFILSKVDLVPVIGDFISEVNEYILQKNSQFIR